MKIEVKDASDQLGIFFANIPSPLKHVGEMALCNTNLLGEPASFAPLPVNGLLQFGSGEKASPRTSVSHDVTIASYDTLRKYYCRMNKNVRQPVKFGPWLESELLRREWNQSDLARRIKSKPGVVSNWIRGTRNPSPGSIKKVADALDVDRNRLLAMLGYGDPDLEVDPDSNEAAILTLVRKIDWESDPARFAGLQVQLEAYLDMDRKLRGDTG